jgi:hypothetical protein
MAENDGLASNPMEFDPNWDPRTARFVATKNLLINCMRFDEIAGIFSAQSLVILFHNQ